MSFFYFHEFTLPVGVIAVFSPQNKKKTKGRQQPTKKSYRIQCRQNNGNGCFESICNDCDNQSVYIRFLQREGRVCMSAKVLLERIELSPDSCGKFFAELCIEVFYSGNFLLPEVILDGENGFERFF